MFRLVSLFITTWALLLFVVVVESTLIQRDSKCIIEHPYESRLFRVGECSVDANTTQEKLAFKAAVRDDGVTIDFFSFSTVDCSGSPSSVATALNGDCFQNKRYTILHEPAYQVVQYFKYHAPTQSESPCTESVIQQGPLYCPLNGCLAPGLSCFFNEEKTTVTMTMMNEYDGQCNMTLPHTQTVFQNGVCRNSYMKYVWSFLPELSSTVSFTGLPLTVNGTNDRIQSLTSSAFVSSSISRGIMFVCFCLAFVFNWI